LIKNSQKFVFDPTFLIATFLVYIW